MALAPSVHVKIEGLKDLRSLVALVEEIGVMRLQPGDVVVLRAKMRVTKHMADEIKASARAVFGDDVKIIVLDNGMELAVVREEDAPS